MLGYVGSYIGMHVAHKFWVWDMSEFRRWWSSFSRARVGFWWSSWVTRTCENNPQGTQWEPFFTGSAGKLLAAQAWWPEFSQEHVKVERTDSVKSRYNLHRCTHTHTSFVYTLFFFFLKKFIGFLKLDLSEEFLWLLMPFLGCKQHLAWQIWGSSPYKIVSAGNQRRSDRESVWAPGIWTLVINFFLPVTL